MNDKFVLHTIAISHYTEKVRWALDYLGIDYQEEQDAGILGVFLTARFVPILHVVKEDISIPNSSDILRYLYGRYYNDEVYSFPRREDLNIFLKIICLE